MTNSENEQKVSRQVRRAQERQRLRDNFTKSQRRQFFRLPAADKRAVFEVSRMIADRSKQNQELDELVESNKP